VLYGHNFNGTGGRSVKLKVNNKILSLALKAASTCLGYEIQKCTTTNVYASVLNNIKFFKFMKP